MDANSPIQPPMQPSDGHVPSPTDLTGNVVPKTEDSSFSFPKLSPDGLTSSATHLPGASAPFELVPDGTQAPPTSTMAQMDMAITSLDPLSSNDVFLPAFSSSSQHQRRASLNHHSPSLTHPLKSEDMHGLSALREQSPGSAHTSSSNPSSAASPVPAPPPFSTLSGSSMNSAIERTNDVMLNRSRSGSLASPGMSNGFNPHPQSSPPQPKHDASTNFSSDFAGIPRPDPVNSPHMAVVDDVFCNIMRAAQSARQACSLGQGIEASSRIDEMRKQINLVSQLLAGTALDSPPNQDSPKGQPQIQENVASPSSEPFGHRHSMSLPRLNGTPPGFIPNFPNTGPLNIPSGPPSLEQVVNAPMSLDSTGSTLQGSPDSESSRKRCASSTGGNRVNKALRLDSSDAAFAPLTQAALQTHPSLTLSGIRSQNPPTSHPSSAIPSPVVPMPPSSIPTGMANATHVGMGGFGTGLTPPGVVPGSRPVSPPLIDEQAQSWAMLQKQLSASAPVTSAHPSMSQAQLQSAFPAMQMSTSSVPSMAEAIGQELSLQASGRLGSDMGVAFLDIGATPRQSQVNAMNPHDLGGVAGNQLAGGTPGSGLPFSSATNASAYPAQASRPPLVGMHTAPVVPQNSGLGSRSSSFSHQHPSSSLYASQGHNASSGLMSHVSMADNQQMQQQQQPEFVPSQAGRRPRAMTWDKQPGRRSVSSSSCEDDNESDYGPNHSFSKSTPPLQSRDNSPFRRPSIAADGSSSSSSANEVPLEYKADVDRIFFEFLNNVCSNLDATDAKGELIHQTLMAKKMQRLDESPDFRPFKFRIQAFTNGFLEELAKHGFTEDKIAMKKIRNYLWTQPYISRFNEDGKKAKSKGNHIWNIDAKKKAEGGWEFRPFKRKLAGAPPSDAYIGVRWSWMPRIWDPQASRANIQVKYSSPNLPPWLSWRDGMLQGTPPPDAQSCEILVEARTMQDGKEELLSQTFVINVASVPASDLTFGARPSLGSDIHSGRRVNSDSMLPNIVGASGRPLQAVLPQPGVGPLSTQDAQMMQVLTSAAQRVAQEAQAHVISASHPHETPGPELQALAKQQHVLTVTAQALDHEVSVPPEAVPPSSHALVAAAQQVVFQAARQVAAERMDVISMTTGLPVQQQPSAGGAVTVNEVSVATQSAVAQAVEITGPLSSEVDVMMTASSLLQQQSLLVTPATVEPPPSSIAPNALNAMRPHSTAAPLSALDPVDF